VKPPVELPKVERRQAVLADAELRQEGDGFRFEGLAAVFDSPSQDLGGFTEVIERGAFRKTLASSPDVPLLINHESFYLLATTDAGTMRMREVPEGLHIEADLAPTSYANDLRILMGRKDVKSMSFGWPRGAAQDSWSEVDGGARRNIRSFDSLLDVSVVTAYPAYQATTASVRQVVHGVKIVTDDGDVLPDELRQLAFAVHRGEVQATEEERRSIDETFAKIGAVSPWVADLARRSLDEDSELRAVLTPPKPDTLAVRRRRLEMRARQAGFVVKRQEPAVETGATVALEGLQAATEAIEAALAQVGFGETDEPDDDTQSGPFTDDQYQTALEAVQQIVEGMEAILENAGLPDPDEAEPANA
jgi:HK97 family phage prohead protease